VHRASMGRRCGQGSVPEPDGHSSGPAASSDRFQMRQPTTGSLETGTGALAITHHRASGGAMGQGTTPEPISAGYSPCMGNSGEKRKGRRHLAKAGTKPDLEEEHSEKQRIVGLDSAVGLAVVIVLVAVIVAAFLLFR
jgi:hypothetical protein